MNRRMRTRMSGGVRGRGLAAPSYSINLNKITKKIKQKIYYARRIFQKDIEIRVI
ncbi:hypothetical protein STH288 [Calderihabitans maritimus]|uniref:Uncharacterized protein n=1 Tax=Calderihabitans maritimus TaxID=1246530 RepID=A0A1Z5HWE9_9FIRM|nr:hypothetical protein STH288 [Calderihabitans maritimus]